MRTLPDPKKGYSTFRLFTYASINWQTQFGGNLFENCDINPEKTAIRPEKIVREGLFENFQPNSCPRSESRFRI